VARGWPGSDGSRRAPSLDVCCHVGRVRRAVRGRVSSPSRLNCRPKDRRCRSSTDGLRDFGTSSRGHRSLRPDIHHNLGTGGFGARIVRVRVCDNDIGTLCFCPTDLLRLLHHPAKVGVDNGSKHDHSVSKGKLSMDYRALVARNYQVFLEAERAAQPFRSLLARRRIAGTE
jgi:hypothetical protein